MNKHLVIRPKNTLYSFILAAMLIFSLQGCDIDIGEDNDRDAPGITLTSHEFGETITGSKTVTVGGTVSNDTKSMIVKNNDLTVNGLSLVGTDFSVDIPLDDGANSVFLQAFDENNNSSSITFVLFYPAVKPTNGQDALYVIGQADFVSNLANQGSTPDESTLSNVTGGMWERNNTILYIADTGNNRILQFNSIPTANNADASVVYGQPDFNTATAGTSGTELTSPNGVYVNDDYMLVADSGNHRVLIWDGLPENGTDPADFVLGQADLTSNAMGCSATSLNNPTSVFLVNDQIVVSDSGNNRILIWNAVPTANGVAADLVVGQQLLTVCMPNDGDGDNVTDANPGANTLSGVGGIWTDGVQFLAADTNNHRVLVWDVFPDENGELANFVLGQADMVSATQELTQSGLDTPKSVSSNGNQILVADSGNVRALLWNAFPAANKPNADVVLGQVDFVSNSAGLSQFEMTNYENVFADRARLFVNDDNRIMLFTTPE